MRRRDFITLLGGTSAAWPLAAHAQQTKKLPTIGFMGADAVAWSPWMAPFVQRLRELGWIEGYTITIEYRWNGGRLERIAEIAAEFVRLKVAVIVTAGPEAATVKRTTSEIPIVFATATDPVGSGLVASLARPGGNATGLSNQSADIIGKRLELLREVVPRFQRLALMFNVDYAPGAQEARDIQAMAPNLSIEVTPLGFRRAEDIAPAFETLRAQADALYVVSDALVAANRSRIITSALTARLPTFFGNRNYVQAGGLMSYGTDIPAQFRRAAELVDKILRGTKPSEIPVEQPTKFELVINLMTAKALGLAVPGSVLNRADEVIE